MNPRDRAKRVQAEIVKVLDNPLVPRDVKSALGEVAALLGEWGDILERVSYVTKSDRRDVQLPSL